MSAREPVARFSTALAALLVRDDDIVRGWVETRTDGTRLLTIELDELPPDLESAGRRAQSLTIRIHALLGVEALGLGIALAAAGDAGEPSPEAEVVYRRTARP